MIHITPEALDAARNAEAHRRAKEADPNGSPATWAVGAYNEYRELTKTGWEPPLKVNPRVLAMQNYIKANRLPPEELWTDNQDFDEGDIRRAFLAGYAAAVRKAGVLQDAITQHCAKWNHPTLARALVDYLASIGE
jgi:hypothetical protein